MRRYLLNPVTLGFVAVLILSLAIWFVGELVLDEWLWMRLWAILTLVLIWALFSGLWFWLRRRRRRKMEAELAGPDPTAEAISEEEAALRQKFALAIKDLGALKFKSGRGGRRNIYEMPWYLFIGNPGAGKTEALKALKRSGFEFLVGSGDKIDIEGVGGTRHCNWIFTNEAVFIDTAGRMVQQGSDADVDKAAWTGFLGMLARNRPLEPINGVILAVSMSEIATATAAEIDDYAARIRARLDELSEAMRATVPVYVMFTKSDLLVGFTEYFQAMRAEGWEQVWGATFPLGDLNDVRAGAAAALELADAEFDALVERLGEVQFARLQDEIDPSLRARIFGFPGQFSSMKPVVSRLLRKVFEPRRDHAPFLLRGFYFTSATQTGQPVDRLIARMAANFGLERQVVGMLAGSGRSYFLGDLLRNVIFPEQGIVRRTMRGRRGGRALKMAAIAAGVVVPIVAAAGFYVVWQHDKAQAKVLTDALTAYEADLVADGLVESVPTEIPAGDPDSDDTVVVERLEARPVDTGDLDAVLAPLAGLRTAMLTLQDPQADAPLWGMGVDAMSSIRAQARIAYENGLDDLMRPRLLVRLEKQMDELLGEPEVLYNYLKAYLMIGGRIGADETFLRDFMSERWQEEYPRNDGPLQTALAEHLDAMIAAGFRKRELNEDGIAQAQAAVAQTSVAERAYQLLRRSAEARALPAWSPAEVGGRTAKDVLVRASGEPLEKPIPGFFSYNGFWTYAFVNIDRVVETATEERWLLDPGAAPSTSLKERARVRQEILDLYYQDYIDAWQGLLADLRFATPQNLEDAELVFNAASSTTSPWKKILMGASDNTRLASLPAEDSPVADVLKKQGLYKINMKSNLVGRLVEGAAEQASRDRPGQAVSDAFSDLHDFVGDGGARSEIGRVLEAFEGLYRTVLDMGRRGGELEILSATDAGQDLTRAVARAPVVVEKSVLDMFEQVDAISQGQKQAQLNDIWRGSVYPECQRLLHGRYPFGRGEPVALLDLERILGPDGVLDQFFQTYLARFVNVNADPWAWTAEGRLMRIPTERLAFFQKTEKLREAFFPRRSPRAEMRFGVSSVAMPQGAQTARFAVGGTPAIFEQGKPGNFDLSWPGDQPANGAQLQVQFGETAPDLFYSAPGDWGLFKLLDAANRVRPGRSGSVVDVDLNVGGYLWLLRFSLRSSANPVALRDDMRGFICPNGL